MKSLLFVPANEKMLSKIESINSDAFIIDLEDSIKKEDKIQALELVKCWLNDRQLPKNVFVRLNSDNYILEANELNGYNVGFMLPKFEDIKYYSTLANVWKNHRVIALIETPMGIINSDVICSCDWIFAVAFGAEDYTAIMNMKNSNELLVYQKGLLVNNAKGNNKIVFDTPSFNITDVEKLKEDIQYSIDLGFDGKLAINPKQITLINEMFSPHDIEYMKKIISIYEESGEAVLCYNNTVYEKMHIERMKRVVKEATDKLIK